MIPTYVILEWPELTKSDWSAQKSVWGSAVSFNLQPVKSQFRSNTPTVMARAYLEMT